MTTAAWRPAAGRECRSLRGGELLARHGQVGAVAVAVSGQARSGGAKLPQP